MVDFSPVTPEHVRQATVEHDRLGRDEFLSTYGFGRNHGYELLLDDKSYDSKAILGVAHGYATGRPAKASEFSGGRDGAAKILTALGFEITEPTSAARSSPPATST